MKSIGFLFDLDGVIVDTANFHYQAWCIIAKELGVEFGEKENEMLKGVGRSESLEKILKLGNLSMAQEEKDDLLDKKNRLYLEKVESLNHDSPLPGAKDFITRAKNDGIKIGIGSSSKNANRILEKIGLKDHFEVIVDGNMISKSKPDPEVFLKGAKMLDLKPENCIVFEDAESGIDAANSAGMLSIGIGSEENLFRATMVFSGLDQVDFSNILSSIEK